MKPLRMEPLSDWDKDHYPETGRLRNCPSDCARRTTCYRGQEIPGNKICCYVPEESYEEWCLKMKIKPDPRVLRLMEEASP